MELQYSSLILRMIRLEENMRKLLLLLLILPFLIGAAPARTKTYTTGQVITASDVTENEDNIYSYLTRGVDTYADGSIVNADISSSAAIEDSKLAQITTASKVSTSALTGTFTGIGSYLTGALPIANGGTASTTASDARTALGLAIGTNVQAYDADLTTYAGITPSANIQSFLGSADYSTARTNLGLAIGTNVQAYDAQLDDLADGTLSGASTVNVSAITGTLAVANGGTAYTTGTIARIQVGNYTGDGAASKEINFATAYQAVFLIIYPQTTQVNMPFMKSSQDGTKTSYNTGSNAFYEDDYIISLDADGFTVGDGTGGSSANHCNINGRVYTYIAF